MKSVLRLAFVLPALLVAAPAIAQPKTNPPAKIRYVALDKMIHKFAAEAREKQSAQREVAKSTAVVASR